MKIYSAPLQGFTEAVWRNVHDKVFGGIDGYYTPFLRYEHGEIRNKDKRDVERKNNTVKNLVPQHNFKCYLLLSLSSTTSVLKFNYFFYRKENQH